MKNILLIVAVFFIVSPSCQKGYTCTCDQSIDTTGGVAVFTYDMSKNEAREKCTQMEGNPFYTRCQLN